jgi:hypothetical protein
MFIMKDVCCESRGCSKWKEISRIGTSKLWVLNFLGAVRLSTQQVKSKQSRTARHG